MPPRPLPGSAYVELDSLGWVYDDIVTVFTVEHGSFAVLDIHKRNSRNIARVPVTVLDTFTTIFTMMQYSIAI